MRNPTLIGGVALLVAALALAVYGQPGIDAKWQMLAPKYQPKLDDRAVQIDPAELLSVTNDDTINLVMLDFRSERDWNAFHLRDAEHVSFDALPAMAKRLNNLGPTGVVVLMSNDEEAATAAWKKLMVLGAPNAYILAGGINRWIATYGHDEAEEIPDADKLAPDTMHYRFAMALGERYPASSPDAHHAAHIEFTPKVKLLKKVVKSGGCG